MVHLNYKPKLNSKREDWLVKATTIGAMFLQGLIGISVAFGITHLARNLFLNLNFKAVADASLIGQYVLSFFFIFFFVLFVILLGILMYMIIEPWYEIVKKKMEKRVK